MTLRLTLENVDKLPDGGPVSVSVNGRGLDIGRHQHLDWTLPDSSRYVSGKHCEIRFRDGGYWLHDVSRNGTFLNGSDARLTDPYRLQSGDRMMIGPYIVAVEIAGVAGTGAVGTRPAAAAYAAEAYDDDPWAPEGDVAAPEDRAAYKPVGPAARLPDFLDTVAPPASVDAGRRVLATGDDVWGPPPPAPPPPDIAPEPTPIAAPIPRRPAATAFEEPALATTASSPELLEKSPSLRAFRLPPFRDAIRRRSPAKSALFCGSPLTGSRRRCMPATRHAR